MKKIAFSLIGLAVIGSATSLFPQPGATHNLMSTRDQDDGWVRFRASASGSAMTALPSGFSVPEPHRKAMSGGALIAYETTDVICPQGTKLAGKRHVNIYVLHVNDSDSDNLFESNVDAKQARIRLNGTMTRYEPGPSYCENGTDYVLAATGPGSLNVSYNTFNHITPRNFIATNAVGSIAGPGLSDTLGPMPAPSGFRGNAATYVCLDELSEKYGVNIPTPPNSNQTVDPRLPMFTSYLAGSKTIPVQNNPPRLTVVFSTSSSEESIGLTVYRPTVLGGAIVEDSIESSKGVQAFVNLDNDDQDEFFDYEIADRDVANDNDLIKVVMTVKPKRVSSTSLGTAQLSILEGSENIRIWETPNKSKRFNHRIPTKVLEEFVQEGTLRKKTLWVEGSVAHTSQRGSKLKFTYSESPQESDQVSITIVGLEKIEWQGVSNSENDDDVLTVDPNHGIITQNFEADPNITPARMNLPDPKGVRVFPGARYNNGIPEVRARDRVKVVATLTVEPVEPINLYFRPFDIDDPTASRQVHPEVDNESKSEDNRGAVEGAVFPKAGKLAGESANGVRKQEFTAKSAEMVFQVTRQPGDNFCIVGSGDPKFLLDVHNSENEFPVGGSKPLDSMKIINKFVNAKKTFLESEVRESNHYVSNALSVWRRCYVEYDKMDPVSGFVVGGRIQDVKPGSIAGTTNVEVDKNFIAHLKAKSNTGMIDCFEGGELKTSVGTFKVLHNSAQDRGNDTLVVQGVIAQVPSNKKYELRDDDFTDHKFDDGIDIPDLDFSMLNRYHTLNYLMFDLTTLEATNTNKTAPFVLNTLSDDTEYLKSNYRFDHIAQEANELAWTIYVLAAFQGTHPEDGDPDGEDCLCGIVDKVNGVGAHIFIEGMNDFSGHLNNGVRLPSHLRGLGERDTIAHEIGHLFGAEHGDTGLIDQQSQHFSGKSINKIRNIKHP